MADPEVMRQYQVLPAIEQTKSMIIYQLNILFNNINTLIYQRIYGVKDEETIAVVKSTVLTLYIMLKPKITEHISSKKSFITKEEDRIHLASIEELFNLDKLIRTPTEFKIEDAIKYSDLLNFFCHDYKITSITYFAGTQMKSEQDITNF